jgi:hypothetical protein
MFSLPGIWNLKIKNTAEKKAIKTDFHKEKSSVCRKSYKIMNKCRGVAENPIRAEYLIWFCEKSEKKRLGTDLSVYFANKRMTYMRMTNPGMK